MLTDLLVIIMFIVIMNHEEQIRELWNHVRGVAPGRSVFGMPRGPPSLPMRYPIHP